MTCGLVMVDMKLTFRYFIAVCIVAMFTIYTVSVILKKKQVFLGTNDSTNLMFNDIDFTYHSNKHDFQYLISEETACRQDGVIFLLVVVCVSAGNLQQRQTIRDTWGSVAIKDPAMKLMFLLGNPNNVTLQSQIIEESVQYKDIIQEDFIDSYRNLSLKSVALLKWVSLFCNEAKYILKSDDDMFVHIPNLVAILRNRLPVNAVIGCRINGAMPLRDKTSKWYASVQEYSKKFYPSYCSGTAYVISRDSIEPLFNVSQSVSLFWLEDIYITGICRTIAHVDIINSNAFTYVKRDPTACSFTKAVTGHRYSLTEIRNIWTEIQNNVTCPKPK